MKFKFNHFNFNISNLEQSLKFYDQALGLKEVGRIEEIRSQDEGGSFKIVYLGDGQSDFKLELTFLENHPQKYDLGEAEFHLAIETKDYDAALKKHQEMGIVCLINAEMGIYFIEDSDGYWVEIIPAK